MNIRKIGAMLTIGAGLLIGATAWALNTQLGQILPYVDCRNQSHWSATVSFMGLATACLAGAISWRWVNQAHFATPLTAASTFIASLGALSALIFAFALSLQGIASLVLSGCER
jgi:ABC-type multidrug transport system permease subunit